jgi:hypothetical protein
LWGILNVQLNLVSLFYFYHSRSMIFKLVARIFFLLIYKHIDRKTKHIDYQ